MNREEFASLPRSIISIIYVLSRCRLEGATYCGLRSALGQRSDSAVRASVREAATLGLVRVLRPTPGRGRKATVRLTPRGRYFVEKFLPQVNP